MFGLFHSKTRTKAHKEDKDKKFFEKLKNQPEKIIVQGEDNQNGIVGHTEDGVPLTIITDENGQDWYAPYRYNYGQ